MNLAEFASLSEVLTGYGPDTILPQNNTQNMAQEYLDILNNPKLVQPVDLQDLTIVWNRISGQPQPQLEELVKKYIMSNENLKGIAQNIIYMWYLGIWYNLPLPDKFPPGFVISSKAYKNGLVWGTMGAHPMGYSEDVFGYWNTAPALPVIQ